MLMDNSKKVAKNTKLVTPTDHDREKHEKEKQDKDKEKQDKEKPEKEKESPDKPEKPVKKERLSAQGIQPPPKALANERKSATPLRREARGKKAPPHLQNGTVLCNRLKIERMMGGGGFGQVYLAVNQSNNQSVAVKVEPCDREAGRMILEQKVLNLLRGTKHTPRLVASGNHENFMYIAMERLGRNLNDLRHRQPHKRFSLGTGLRVAVQMVEALKDIHTISYLHRDVKPSNMCVGLSDKDKRTIFLVDFGMTRRYRNDKGEFRKSRTYAGFRGTLRYVSLTVHRRHDQGPKDDCQSLLYSIVEICEGSLPWKHIEDEEHMAQKKMRTPFDEMLMYLPRSIKDIADYLEPISFDTMPDYELISQIYSNAIPNDVDIDGPFDWESLIPSSKSLEIESGSNN